jgi:formate/nitrite transporter FocA (FNT family)
MLAGLVPLDMGAMIANLVVVSAGNVVGGAVLVALVYWVIFARHGGGPSQPKSQPIRRK